MKQQEFENDEAFEMAKESCDGCKGNFYMSDSGCYESCEGFQKEYQEIVTQLKEEDEIHQETKT